MVELPSEALEQWSNEEIAAWAWNYLGLYLDPSWTRGRLITQLMKSATEIA